MTNITKVEPPQAMAGRTTQIAQENHEERVTRSSADFKGIEKNMPKLAYRFSSSLKDNLSSYLGTRNPLYKTVDPKKDAVWLFDNTAFQDRIGRWRAEFVAAYFLKNSGQDTSEIVAWIGEQIGLADDDAARDTIAKRVQPLLDTILPAHAVNIDIGDMVTRLGPSGRNGVSSDQLAIPGSSYKDGDVASFQAVKADAMPFNTFFASREGWAVVSDVDDTIKKTLTASPIGILETTFAEEPEPIKGMPAFYQHLKQKLQNPPFWYLTASPYNLYPFLRDFRNEYYPPGTMILRDSSWMNLAGLLADLTQGTQAYKVDRLEKIHGWFPKRKFILIGDSTQTDPEAYGEMYRKQPKWIGAIFIRKVTGVAEMDEEEKNSAERFKTAFKNVPESVWTVFEDPQGLYEKVDALVDS